MTDDFTAPLTVRSAETFITRYAVEGESDDALDALAECAAYMSDVASGITDANRKILANGMQTEIKNRKDAKAVTDKRYDTAARKVDATRAHTEAVIEKLVADTAPPAPRDAVQAVQASEVRALLRGMTRADRMKALNDAMDDDSFIGAAVSGNPLLSGLSASETAAVVESWRKRKHPATLDRIARLKAALGQLDRIAGMFQAWIFGLHAEKNAAIEAAEHAERLAKEATGAA